MEQATSWSYFWTITLGQQKTTRKDSRKMIRFAGRFLSTGIQFLITVFCFRMFTGLAKSFLWGVRLCDSSQSFLQRFSYNQFRRVRLSWRISELLNSVPCLFSNSFSSETILRLKNFLAEEDSLWDSSNWVLQSLKSMDLIAMKNRESHSLNNFLRILHDGHLVLH